MTSRPQAAFSSSSWALCSCDSHSNLGPTLICRLLIPCSLRALSASSSCSTLPFGRASHSRTISQAAAASAKSPAAATAPGSACASTTAGSTVSTLYLLWLYYYRRLDHLRAGAAAHRAGRGGVAPDARPAHRLRHQPGARHRRGGVGGQGLVGRPEWPSHLDLHRWPFRRLACGAASLRCAVWHGQPRQCRQGQARGPGTRGSVGQAGS
eukprot:scaffold66498_cov77-Phaeocystis_antarctica.AAC.1